MLLQGEVYVVENNPPTYIIRLERREGSNDHPGVGFRETELENLIARMENEVGHRDALQGTWNSDALFVRPDVTTLVTGNTEQRVTQTRNCTATSG